MAFSLSALFSPARRRPQWRSGDGDAVLAVAGDGEILAATPGAEALIGLVPVIGDAAGLVLSGYVLLEAQRAGVSGATKRRMLRNMLVDFVGGLVPVVGDAFDAIFKANTRNTRLVRQDLLKQLGAEAPRRFPWGTLVGLSILFGVITAAGVALLA